MVATGRRNIKAGKQYEKYFDAPANQESYLSYLGNNFDTLSHMRQIVMDTLSQTEKIARVLKGKTLEATARNIFNFVYHHYQYKQDSSSAEELRSPYRAWKDRKTGVDCDCYTITTSSILTNLGIDHAYKMTKYGGRSYFQHVYVVVPVNQQSYSKNDFEDRSKYIVIDPVVDQFDYEKRPSYAHHEIIKVSKMKSSKSNKSSLNGIEDVQWRPAGNEAIASALMGDEAGLGFFGRKARARRKARRASRSSRRSARRSARQLRRKTRRATRSLPLFSKKRRAARKAARQQGRDLRRSTRQTTRSLKRNVRRNPTSSNAAARIAAMRKAVAARKVAAQRKVTAARPKPKPSPAQPSFSDSWLRKLFANQKKWADKNHKGILERQIKALIPYVQKSAERRKGTTGKYLASRGWSLSRIMADARRLTPQLVPAAAKPAAPAAHQFSKSWLKGFFTGQKKWADKNHKGILEGQIKAMVPYLQKDAGRRTSTTGKYFASRGWNVSRIMGDARRVTPHLVPAVAKPARSAASSSRPAPAASSKKLSKLNRDIAVSSKRTSQLARRLQELRRRNALLLQKQRSTSRIAVNNQQKLNKMLAAKRKAALQQAAARSGRITEIKTFAPKEASIKPLR